MNSISFPVRSAYTDYGKFASGKKIHNASDGAAELAIIQKQEEQIRGYEAGKKNIGVMKSLAKVTDVAQSGVNDYLQRINELTVRSSNSFMSQSDKASIQQEIDMLKDGISQIASTTTFNEKKLLDGSNPSFNAAIGSGTMTSITTGNSALEALGLADYNITGKYNSKEIINALSEISRQRTETIRQDERSEQKEKAQTKLASEINSSTLQNSMRSGLNAENGAGAISSIATANSNLQTHGLGDFSITGQYNSKEIISALSEISRQRIETIRQDEKQEQEEKAQTELASEINGSALRNSMNSDLNAENGMSAMSSITTANSDLQARGLGDFSITGQYNSKEIINALSEISRQRTETNRQNEKLVQEEDSQYNNNLKQISDALSEVNRQRSKTGAQANGLEYAYHSLSSASYNTTAAQSRIGDLDYPKAISEQRKAEVLQEYSNFVQRANMRIQGNKMIFFE